MYKLCINYVSINVSINVSFYVSFYVSIYVSIFYIILLTSDYYSYIIRNEVDDIFLKVERVFLNERNNKGFN